MKELLKQIEEIEKLHQKEMDEAAEMHFGKHDTTLGALVDSGP